MGDTHYGGVVASDGFKVGDKDSKTSVVDSSGNTPVVLAGVIADVSSAETIYFVSPVAGVLKSIYTVLEGAITVADADLTTEIDGSSVTGSDITVANASSAAGDVDSATPTAANTVSAGSYITVATDGGSTDAQRLWVSLHIAPE